VSNAAAFSAPRDLDQSGWDDPIALPNGLSFRLPSRAMRGAAQYVIKEIFRGGRYSRPGFEIKPDYNVVDIGANMGLFALWAAPQANRGRVLAIEPTSIIDCLVGNIAANGLTNITPIRAAVGVDGEQIELVTYPGFNIVSHHAGWRPAAITRLLIRVIYGKYQQAPVIERAPCISLGKLMEEQGLDRINYLKVDCEGGEYAIFRNLAAEHWRRIDRVAMEFHELGPGQDHRELVSILHDQGFRTSIRKRFLDYYCMKFGELWAWRE
jgi:FkbM family methyltransferase